MRVNDKYIKTKADEKAVDEGCWWDVKAGEKVAKFFSTFLTLSTGINANKPFHLLDWQLNDIIMPLYSWKTKQNKRRFTRCLITTGKKQGKSVLVAGLGLHQLLADNEESPLIVLGACTRDQASELYKEILFSISHNQKLRDVLHTTPSTKAITYPKKNGQLKAISWDAPAKGGLNCSTVILDELALMQNSSLYDMLKSSMIARSQPLFIMLSNAGYDKSHFYYRIYQHAKAILTNESTDTSFLPVVYEVPEEANWKDKSNFELANPSLKYGITPIESFTEDYQDALANKAGEMHFRRFRLNQFTSKENAWLDLDAWDACEGEFPSLNNQSVYIAVDLSSTTDLTSIVAVYPIDGNYYVKSYNYVPKSALIRRDKQNLKDYQTFKQNGDLTITDGNAVDYEMIRNAIKAIPGRCEMVIFDKWNSAETSQMLAKEGFNVFNFPQFPSYFNEPTKKLEQLVMDKKIVHDGNLCLRWAINNVQLEVDTKGLCSPSKSSDHMKIDPAVALIMAISQAMLSEVNKSMPSVYETRGIVHI